MPEIEKWKTLRDKRRAEVLAQTKAADAAWKAQPGRNLVLFFDGTGNVLGNSRDTNVVKLLRLVKKREPYAEAFEQIVYYDPGVGTSNEFPPAGIGSRSRGVWQLLEGLALGQGAFDNVAEGYEFLCRTYQPRDRIWLFGFSRGAFTARAVGGMVNMYGLVYPSGLPMVRTLVRTYFAESKKDGRKGPDPQVQATDEGLSDRDRFALDVIEQFSLGRTPLIHFTGVWDTVESIGLTGGVAITNSKELEHKRFVHVRHALALHETRQKYKPRIYQPPEFTADEQTVRSFEQIWFRGVHSDIGGSYEEAGLSNITLNWMAKEAESRGLELAVHAEAPEDAAQPLHDQVLDSPYWLLTGLNSRDRSGDESPIDTSALPIQGAMPAKRTTMTWLALHLGHVLLAAAFALLATGLLWRPAPCGVATWFADWPAGLQWLATITGGIRVRCPNASARSMVPWDVGLLLAWAWLAYPVAWAVRRACAGAIVAGTALPAWLGRAWIGLWIVLATGLLGHVLGLYLPGHWALALTVALLFIAQMACLAWMVIVFIAGALGGHGNRA